MASTIPLAKPLNPAKLHFPVYLSRKIDGVPVRININYEGHTVVSRQGKPVPSVNNLVEDFADQYRIWVGGTPITLVGEVYQRSNPGAPFKDTSGIVRRQEDQSEYLAITLFDCSDEVGVMFDDRWEWMRANLVDLLPGVEVIYQQKVDTPEHLEILSDNILTACPHFEGLVARSHDDPWCPGKRSWGYQKILREPTTDLWIVGCKEAKSEDGEPLGMAGRLIASYKGEQIGIGPGKLNHADRRAVFEYFKSPHSGPRMAQIKHKDDKSYDALRQPTFQCWRDDKHTADA